MPDYTPKTTDQTEAVVVEDVVPTTSLVVADFTLPPAITANFAEMEAYLDGELAIYDGVVVERSRYKDAKRDRARLNALEKSISDARLRVKRLWMAPFDPFESEAKRLAAKVKDKSAAIDKQIKAIEADLTEEKLAEARKYWRGFVLSDAVSFEQIENPQWKNLTVLIGHIKEDIDAKAAKIASDVDTLAGLSLPHHEDALVTYYETLDFAKAVNRSKELEERLRATREAERQRLEYEAAREAERAEAQKAAEAFAEPDCVEIYEDGEVTRIRFLEPVETAPAPAEAPAVPQREVWHVELVCTRKELQGVISYCTEHGIKGRAIR